MYDVRDGQNRAKYHASEYQSFCISLHTLHVNAYDTMYKRYSGGTSFCCNHCNIFGL